MITLSVVIPTKDREGDLLKCIESILKQTVKPVEVLVVDDGHISEILKEKIKQMLSESDIYFRYFKKKEPSSSESRNLGAKESTGQIVLFLDDDIVLENDYVENLLDVWSRKWDEERLAGVSGVIVNSKKKSFAKIIFEKIFCLYSKKSWAILPWGFQRNDFNIKREEIADWVPSGLASFRKEIFDKYRFRLLQPGRVALEDFEFCWQLKNNGYYFIITPFSRSVHKESVMGKDSNFISGFKDGLDRKLIFNIHAQKTIKNYYCFCLAAIGCVLASIISGQYEMAFGMIRGYLQKKEKIKQ